MISDFFINVVRNTVARSSGSLPLGRPLWLVFLALGLILGWTEGWAQDLDRESYYRAVEYCRGDVSRPMALSPDRKILCFDGTIAGNLAPSFVAGLEENGLFVVRSLEGVGSTALALANVLLQRRATVVIYDYCLSACASYFVFASVRTYVLKGALVAWHDGGSGFLDCLSYSPHYYGPTMVRAPCDPLPYGLQDGYDAYLLARKRFYSERSNNADFVFPPAGVHISRILWNMYGDTGVFPNVAWTLNTAYLHSFKTKIHYEAYPASQDEVDEMVVRLPLRLRVRKVIYDP